eukprot:6439841-Ditylum_brightwellii.AAC.1
MEMKKNMTKMTRKEERIKTTTAKTRVTNQQFSRFHKIFLTIKKLDIRWTLRGKQMNEKHGAPTNNKMQNEIEE